MKSGRLKNSVCALSLVGVFGANSIAIAVPDGDALLRYRDRMSSSPKYFSFEDRVKLREEMLRQKAGDDSLGDNRAAAQAIHGMQYGIQRYNSKSSFSRIARHGVKGGLAATSLMAEVGSFGTATPAVVAVNAGAELIIDPVFDAIDASIQSDYEDTMRFHLGNMPKGTLRTREEAVASLRKTFGSDVLLSDLPKSVQEQIQQNPGVFATYQQERNARVDAFLAGLSEDVLELQGQTQGNSHDIEVLKKQTMATELFITQFAATTQQNLKNLAKSQKATQEALGKLGDVVSEHSKRLDLNGRDIEYFKGWMAGKMSNAELLDASRSGVISIPEDKLKKIELFSKVEKFQEDAGKVLNAAMEVTALAGKFGLKAEVTAKISKGIAFAQAGVGMAASIATGNYFAAVKMLGSFFGGGPDAATQRHQEVMKALGKIHELQVQILKNQQMLSKQIQGVQDALTEAHRDIVQRMDERFNRVDLNIAKVNALVTSVSKHVKIGDCGKSHLKYAQLEMVQPLESISEAGLSRFFADRKNLGEVVSCRDGLFNLFFESQKLGELQPRELPDEMMTQGVSGPIDRTRDVNAKWNSDQDFYALSDVLEVFHELDPEANPSIAQVLQGLELDSPTVSAVLAHSQMANSFNAKDARVGSLRSRVQADVLAEVASQYRISFPLFQRATVDGRFLDLDSMDPNVAGFRETRFLNLKLGREILEVSRSASAQERLVGGGFMIPRLVRFMREPQAMFSRSKHVRRDKLIRIAARDLSKVVNRNPYLMRNAALYMMAQASDTRMGFDRMAAISKGAMESAPYNARFAATYKKAYESGNLESLRRILPPDWKILCESERDEEFAHAWAGSFGMRARCEPDHEQRFAYVVRMKGFSDFAAAEKREPDLDIQFVLPSPEDVVGERMIKRSSLARLEEEMSALEAVLLGNQELNRFNEKMLRSFDQAVIGNSSTR